MGKDKALAFSRDVASFLFSPLHEHNAVAMKDSHTKKLDVFHATCGWDYCVVAWT